jgi:two-component sensor histidine kinase
MVSLDRLMEIWWFGLRRRSPAAFSFAVACVLVATAVHIVIGLLSPEVVVFAPYYSAILVATLVAGGEAGCLALISSGAIVYLLLRPPEWGADLTTLQDLGNWALYGISSGVIILAAGSYRGLMCRLRYEQKLHRLLKDELAHRVRNMFANVQAVVGLTLADNGELRQIITGRIAALEATNGLLMQTAWQAASLKDVLVDELGAYGLSRIAVDGEDIRCPSDLALILAMIIHELTTNAAKYGALSQPAGRIEISWRTVRGRLKLTWIEHCNVRVTNPNRRGFGTTILYSGVRQFDGDVDRTFTPDGMTCTIDLLLPAARIDHDRLKPFNEAA